MIIDEQYLTGGIDAEVLYKLISRHMNSRPRYSRLLDYYLGKHDIEGRKKFSSGTVNNKIVCNHAKYIVDMARSYLVGNPVTYACSDGYDIEAVKNCYLEQDIAHLDSGLERDMGIYGRAYELLYIDEKSNPRSVRVPPENTFVVYSASVDEKPLFGVHYYIKYDIDGNPSGTYCIVCDDTACYIYENDVNSFMNMELKEVNLHYFNEVPIIEYRNNEEAQGDFEQLIPLINAYNLLCSDRVNDKEQFVEAFLFLSGIELDSEQALKLREERILMGYEGSEAKYLSKVMSETDVEVLRDSIKQDIHRFSMVPDLSDESFGNNLSGVAIKYKLMGFEQHVRNKERLFTKGLKHRFHMYNNYLSLKGSMQYVPIHRVDVVFNRNLPVNELEISEMVNNLRGLATNETLLAQLSFVSDPKEESELSLRERRKIKEVLQDADQEEKRA